MSVFFNKVAGSGLINTFLTEHLQPQLIRFLSKEFMALQSDIWRLLLRAFCFFSINFSIVNFSCSIHYSPVLLFYTPWKHQKTLKFSDVLRGYIKATPGCNGLKPIVVHWPFSINCYLKIWLWKTTNFIKAVILNIKIITVLIFLFAKINIWEISLIWFICKSW